MGEINRRRFIETSVVTTVGLATAGGVLAASPYPDIVDVHGSDGGTMVAAALAALGGIGRFVRKGDYVVIKPNAAFANPASWATTTSPEVVAATVRACEEAGAKRVTVVEYPQAKGKKCLDRCGITEALSAFPKAKLSILESQKDFRKVSVKGGVVFQSIEVAKAVLSADVLINLPTAKAHEAAAVSFGLKNAMGLIYDRQPFHTLFDLHQGIADLGRVIRPSLTILDATRALLTNGPQGPGETLALGRLIAGANVVSVDAYGLGLAKFNKRQMTPADARHIALAAKAGLGQDDVSKLRIKTVRV